MRATWATSASARSLSSPATWSRRRAKAASSQAGPPASAISSSTAALEAVGEHRRRAVGRGRQRQRDRRREARLEVSQRRRRDRQQHEAAGAGAHRDPLLAGRVEDLHADASRPLLDERRVGLRHPAAAGQLDRSRQRPERPARQPASLQRRAGRSRQLRLQPRPHLRAQRLEVVALGDPAALLVLDPEAHSQPRRQAQAVEVGRGDAHAAQLADLQPRSCPAAARWRPPPASAPRATCAATSGTGTSGRRSSFGSERISVVTRSSRKAGTSHSKPCARSPASSGSGTCAVTPSCSAPGSKW